MMDDRVLQLMDKLGMLPKGDAKQGEILRALDDTARSAIAQSTSGGAKHMDGLPQVMAGFQKRMTPEAYRALMEDQIMVNSSPLAQIMDGLGMRRPEGR